MARPVEILIGGQSLGGFTSMSLTRKKKDSTGSLDVDVFMNYAPTEAVLDSVTRNLDVYVHIGGHRAFTGIIDTRIDTGVHNSYNVKLSARGKTKSLVDSSHQHETGTILRPTSRSAFEDLLKPFDVAVEWLAEDVNLDRVRLTDGGNVIDELYEIAEQCSLFVFEGRDGKLRVTDAPEETSGESLVLGKNVLGFRTEQSADTERGEVLVKGHLNSINDWGVSAIVPTLKRVADNTVPGFSPTTVHLFGNATPERIDQRAQYEMNKRAAASKRITVDVFHLQQADGTPWDIGSNHYVELPPAGVFGTFEIVEITYTVAEKKLTTKLTLAPTVVKLKDPAVSGSSLPEISNNPVSASIRAARAQVSDLVDSWAVPALEEAATVVTDTYNEILSTVEELSDIKPPLLLPGGSNGTDIT